MEIEKLIGKMLEYRPWNEQEAMDRDEIIRQIRLFPDIFTRENHNAHITASAWITDPSRTKLLMVYHNIYDSWSWVGGHADGETNLLAVALRETREETGVKTVRPLSEDIFSLEILTVDGHEKRGSLIIRYRTVGNSLDEESYLLIRKRPAVTFIKNDLKHVHGYVPLFLNN